MASTLTNYRNGSGESSEKKSRCPASRQPVELRLVLARIRPFVPFLIGEFLDLASLVAIIVALLMVRS